MRTNPAFIAIVLLLAGLTGSLHSHAGSAGTPAELAQRIRARLDAYGRGSAADWGRYVADDCICGMATKAGMEAIWTPR